ncbi:Phosphatidylethanolamine N-methyltransferase [Bienertia sinuspersici]
MGMLITAMCLLILPQILPPTLPPPPSLLLFLPVIIMGILLHYAFCLSPKVPIIIDADYACI